MLITLSLRTPCIDRLSLHRCLELDWRVKNMAMFTAQVSVSPNEYANTCARVHVRLRWSDSLFSCSEDRAPVNLLWWCAQAPTREHSIARGRQNYPRSVARESGRSRTCTLLDHHPKFVPASHQNQILDKHVGEINNLFMVFIVLRICSGITYTRSMRKRNKG
jgi:hypothetical protein